MLPNVPNWPISKPANPVRAPQFPARGCNWPISKPANWRWGGENRQLGNYAGRGQVQMRANWRIGELVADWAGPARRSFDRRLAETEANAQHLGLRCAAAATNLRAEAELHERREAVRIEALREWHIDQVVAIEPAQNEAAVGTVVL